MYIEINQEIYLLFCKKKITWIFITIKLTRKPEKNTRCKRIQNDASVEGLEHILVHLTNSIIKKLNYLKVKGFFKAPVLSGKKQGWLETQRNKKFIQERYGQVRSILKCHGFGQ